MTIEEYLETQSPATRAQVRNDITLYRCRMIWEAAKRDVFEWINSNDQHRKPEHGKIVLICIVTEQLKRQIPIRAVWYDRFTEEDNYNENEATEYCEEKDAYFVREGWYEFNQCDEVNWAITDTVTHWAEIPLPPVE